MGTVVTVCMLIAILLSFGGKYLPASFRVAIATITAAAGAWNVFWHGLRHIGEFWGHMALASGALMLVLSVLIILANRQSSVNSPVARYALAAVLLPFALYYAWTIYNL